MFGTFMLGARSRLLSPSVPFRFFGAAVLLPIPAWGLLAVFAGDAPGFPGGTGHVLAALHLITLGVLTMTAMGAAFQLLPVATRKPVRSVAACKTVFWLFLPGVLILAHGMGDTALWAMEIGGGLVGAALLLFALLLADNLRRIDDDMRTVAEHAWGAVASLVLLGGLGLALVADFRWGFLGDHHALALAHAVVAAYGFMGLLVMGFSFVLVPMFALTPPPDLRLGRWSARTAIAAVSLTALGLALAVTPLVLLGAMAGLVAVGLHLWAMAKLMRARMRKSLGDSFRLIRLAWGLLPVSIGVGALAAAGLDTPRTGPLFGFLLVFGWLLTFLLGVLQRILPFLASMHSVRPGVKPVLVSALTADRPLRLHLIGHVAALTLCALGLGLGQAWLVRLGAGLGLCAALCFALASLLVWHRLRLHFKNAL